MNYEKYQKKQEQHLSSVDQYFLQTLDKLDALVSRFKLLYRILPGRKPYEKKEQL